MTSTADLLAAGYGGISDMVGEATADELARETRCAGWTVLDLLYHLLLDAQRALVTLASPAAPPADVDAATYWAPHKPGATWAAGHAEFVRRSVAAHEAPRIVVRRWTETAGAAVRAVRGARPGHYATQGHVLALDDFVSTLVVEGVVHHLDLLVALPDAQLPAAEALAHCRSVFDRILGTPAPADWPDADYALCAGGRRPLPPDVAQLIGSAAGRFPLLG
jgi:uncharacterized protein (TIGR03083 family)